ncbi:MAG: hypothetical protein GY774_40455 [Planctomycetes bacterium]|nr:hypothetical protein [Planctomycetota bacterium]
MCRTLEFIILLLVCSTFCAGQKTTLGAVPEGSLKSGEFKWIVSEPVLEPRALDGVQLRIHQLCIIEAIGIYSVQFGGSSAAMPLST